MKKFIILIFSLLSFVSYSQNYVFPGNVYIRNNTSTIPGSALFIVNTATGLTGFKKIQASDIEGLTVSGVTPTITGINGSTVTGTYPNLTVNSPLYQAGSGIAINGNVISATGGGGTNTSITGIDPIQVTQSGQNFIIGANAINTITGAGSVTVNTEGKSVTIIGTGGVAEDFTILSYTSTVQWNTNNNQYPLGKLTCTGSFFLDMQNVKSGSSGVFKLTKNTSSPVTLTFDTEFLNKTLNTTITSYTFNSTANTSEYYLSYIVDGSTIEWVINDYFPYVNTVQWARVRRAATQSIPDNSITGITYDTEFADNSNIFTTATGTRLSIPGSGNKIATVSISVDFAANITGIRRVFIYKNASILSTTDVSVFSQLPLTGGATTTVTFSTQIDVIGGDYIEIMAYQNSTTTLNVTSTAAIKIENRQ